jgi:Kef-type K+ transport system membrane component KefB
MSGHGPRPTPRSLLEGVVALLVLVGGLWLLRVREVTGGPLLSLGLLVVAGAVAGRIAAFLSLPRLTGYLIAGVIAGPHVTGAVSGSDVKALVLVNGLALALIALQAGAEITLPVLKRTWRSVLWSALFQTVLVIGPVALVFALVAPQLGFLDGLSFEVTLAIGAMWGTISLSHSPAATLAIIGETGAKGPMTD